MRNSQGSSFAKSLAVGLGLLTMAGLTGCQSDINGQTSPSAYAQRGDIRYYPPGPEFKLSKEAAALEAYRRNSGMQPVDEQASPASYTKSACSCASCARSNSVQLQ